jgi:3-oxoacyl-[acyl-carrier-protein] synthase II
MFMKNNNSKIVVTSLGVSSPNGNSLESFMTNYENKQFTHNTHIEDETLENDLNQFNQVNQRRMDRLTKITMMAAVSCIEGANLSIDETNINRVGGIFCTEYGPIASARNFINSGFELGLDSASPLIFPYTVGNAAPGTITVLMKARGFNTTVSGYNPIAYAFDIIKSGKAEAILTGGFEELTTEIEEAYSTRTVIKNSGKKEISAVKSMSEGSAMLFIENQSFAISRKANILFEVCGYGVSSNLQREEISIDNFGYISPKIIEKTMRNSLVNSEIEFQNISMIISLGRTDSHQIDSEKEAISNIWLNKPPKINYIKKVLGETFGASDCFAMLAGYIKGLELKNNEIDKVFIMVNSYHIGGNCFSLIISI